MVEFKQEVKLWIASDNCSKEDLTELKECIDEEIDKTEDKEEKKDGESTQTE